MDEKVSLIEAQIRIRNARNELVMAVIALDLHAKSFKYTIASLKETIGDLGVSEAKIDKFLE